LTDEPDRHRRARPVVGSEQADDYSDWSQEIDLFALQNCQSEHATIARFGTRPKSCVGFRLGLTNSRPMGEILVKFSQEEIEMARELRRLGLKWEPSVGHYVYDENRCCQKGSPFQDRLYFILNYELFMNRIGGVERFKEVMLWLPTWHDARELLRILGVSDEEVAVRLQGCKALENRNELLVLYEMIAESLPGAGVEDH
jgi:hypothetical protein